MKTNEKEPEFRQKCKWHAPICLYLHSLPTVISELQNVEFHYGETYFSDDEKTHPETAWKTNESEAEFRQSHPHRAWKCT